MLQPPDLSVFPCPVCTSEEPSAHQLTDRQIVNVKCTAPRPDRPGIVPPLQPCQPCNSQPTLTRETRRDVALVTILPFHPYIATISTVNVSVNVNLHFDSDSARSCTSLPCLHRKFLTLPFQTNPSMPGSAGQMVMPSARCMTPCAHRGLRTLEGHGRV